MEDLLKKEIILLGPGQVGQAFLRQWMRSVQGHHRPMQVTAVADSRACLVRPDGFSLQELEEVISMKHRYQPLSDAGATEPSGVLEQLLIHLRERAIVVDTSAADDNTGLLLRALEQGASVAMANKKNLTQPWELSAKFFHHPRARYESTVCAAMPVMSCLSRLRKADDEVSSIEGILSGTLAYLCSQIDHGCSYSSAVRAAHQLGYTEPDARDDLGGKDVARKALILARACGWPLEMSDIRITPLFSPALADCPPGDFLRRCDEMDVHFEQRRGQAASQQNVLRYLARVTPNGGSSDLVEVPAASEFGSLRGTGNRVVIHSHWHNDPPLVISGAGAGAGLTASGVLADVIELAFC